MPDVSQFHKERMEDLSRLKKRVGNLSETPKVLEQKLAPFARNYPILGFLVLSTLAYISYLISFFVLIKPVGGSIYMPDYPGIFPIEPGAWTALIFSCAFGHSIIFNSLCRFKIKEDLAETARLAGNSDRIETAMKEFWGTRTRRTIVLFTLIGLAISILVIAFAYVGLREIMPAERAVRELVWFVIFVPPFLCFSARAIALTLLSSFAIRSSIQDWLKPDLFDMAVTAPLMRTANRYALGWVTTAVIGSMFFINLPIEEPALAFFMIVFALSTALAAYFLPVNGIRKVIEEQKTWHKEKIRDRLAPLALQLEQGNGAVAPEVTALLALETRIQDVREWPIDTPTFARVALLLMIPLGSWLGGALVEKLLDVFI